MVKGNYSTETLSTSEILRWEESRGKELKLGRMGRLILAFGKITACMAKGIDQCLNKLGNGLFRTKRKKGGFGRMEIE
jgi:hypothetical protein